MNDDVQISVNAGRDAFFYKGKIIDDTDPDFILFKDRKIGEVKISKAAIIAIQKLRDGE